MSVHEQELGGRSRPSELVADFLATFAIFGGLAALVYSPGRVGTGALFVAVLAAALGGAGRRIVTISVAVTTACWFLGMAIAVILGRPIF